MKISTTTLQRYYKENKVAYRSPKTVYKQAMQQRHHLDSERRQFAQIIATIIATNKPLIYIDETSFNPQMIKNKSWSTRDQPNLHVIQAGFGARITVFGAIGNCLTEPVYTLLHGTQSENYIIFLHEVVAKLRPS